MQVSMTKTGLTDFIQRKIATIKADISRDIKETVDAMMDPVLNDHVDTKEIERLANKLSDPLSEAIRKYSLFDEEWDCKKVVTSLNSKLINFNYTIKTEIKKVITLYVSNPSYRSYDFKDEKITQTVENLNKMVAPMFAKKRDLDKLQIELERIIKNEASGNRAYKSLIAHGVDMTGYEEANQNLPAIVNLSVDVCILNGNCQESA